MPAKAGIQEPSERILSDVMKRPCMYILSNKRNGTLYIGVTSDIIHRVWEHKNSIVEGFTKTYGVHQLVYLEFHETMLDAIAREKRLKAWKRAWKINLIEQGNEGWRDLYEDLLQ